MTITTIDKKLEHLKNTGQFFCFSFGGFFSADELLSKKLGRKVEIDEAEAYLLGEREKDKKDNFINKIKQHSKMTI